MSTDRTTKILLLLIVILLLLIAVALWAAMLKPIWVPATPIVG
jgi:hypothetical protein